MLILKIVAPNGKVTTGKLGAHALIKVGAGHRYELVDSLTGLAPEDIRLKRIGRKLILQSDSQATVVELVNFYPVSHLDAPLAFVSLPGVSSFSADVIAALTPETQNGLPVLDLSAGLSSEIELAEKMTGFEVFPELIQVAQANTGTMNDLLAAAPSDAGAAGSSGGSAGGAGAGAGAGAGTAAAAGGIGIGAVAIGAVALAAAASGGGGGGSSSTAAATTGGSTPTGGTTVVAAVKVSGVAIDGYLSNARVFRDENGNKIWDTGEDFVVTDAKGNWTGLGGTATKNIVLAPMTDGTGAVITKDISTGKVFSQTLSAAPGSTIVSPVTTMIAKLVEKGKTMAQAQDEIAESFGINTNIDLSTYDPLATATGAGASATDKSDALKLQKLNIQLASILTVGAKTANDSDATQTGAENSDAVFEALFAKIDAAGTGAVDLSSTAVIQGVFDGLANTISDPVKKAAFQALDDNIVASLESITNAIENVSGGTDITAALTQIVGTQLVAQENLVTSIGTAITTGGGAVIDTSAYSGANLLTAVDTASQNVEDIVPSTNTVTTVGEPGRPLITSGTGTTADLRLTQTDITAGIDATVSLTSASLAQAGDKLVLMLNGVKLAEYTLLAADIPAGTASTSYKFDNIDLGTDGSKRLNVHLERGTTVGPNSNDAIVTVDTNATAPSALALVAADDTGASATDGFTSKTTVKVQGTAEFGSTVTVTDGTATTTAITASDGTFVATLTGLTAGSHSVTATAVDFSGNTSAASSALTVFVSTAPTKTTIAAQTVAEGAAFTLNASTSFSDGDAGDALTYSATGLPTGITISATTGVISGSFNEPGPGVGANNVNVTATDKSGLTASNAFTLTVTNVNDAPTGALAITGAAAKTQVLSVAAGTLADDDGLGTLSFQWQVSADGVAAYTNVAGATSAALPALTSADIGKFYKVVATYTDG
ncbi:MAG: putative Ig domain-containing protein, partial [Burkholderiales bacterium]